jgi:hypothetical protein
LVFASKNRPAAMTSSESAVLITNNMVIWFCFDYSVKAFRHPPENGYKINRNKLLKNKKSHPF